MATGMDVMGKSLEELEKEITCGMCQQHYCHPKVLPCHHYYCKLCILKQTFNTGTFSCPKCLKESILPEGREDKLPTAFFIDRLKAVFYTMELAHGKVAIECGMCGESGAKAEAFCPQCNEYVCQNCIESHKRMKKAFSGHEVVSFQQVREGGTKDIALTEPPAKKCPVHEELCIVYCFDCEDLICHHCTVKDHKDHNFEFSKVAAPGTGKQLVGELEPFDEVLARLSCAVKKIETSINELEVQEDSIVQSIRTSFQELRKLLKRHEEEIVLKARETVREKLDRLSGQKKSLALATREVESIVDYTKKCVKHNTDNQVMCMHAELQCEIQQEIAVYSHSGRSLEPVEEADVGVEVSCSEAFQQFLQTKAKIIQLPVVCEIRGQGEVHKASQVILSVKLSNGRPVRRQVESQLERVRDRSIITSSIVAIRPGEYRIEFTPTVHRQHQVSVSVGGQKVVGSPFPVFVSISPTQLGQPVRVWKDINYPTGIAVNSVGEIIVAAGEEEKEEEEKRVEEEKNEEKEKEEAEKEVEEENNEEEEEEEMVAEEMVAEENEEEEEEEENEEKEVEEENEGEGNIVIFNEEGVKLRTIQGSVHQFAHLSDVAVDGEDNIYFVSERANKIYKSNKEGSSVVGKTVQPVSGEEGHYSVAVVGEEVMVSECGNKGVITVYDKELNYVRQIVGRDMGEFLGISADSHGNMYVIDSDNSGIRVFSKDGKILRSFGCDSNGVNKLESPGYVCASSQYVYVTDWCHDNVSVFTTQGNYVTSFGQRGDDEGSFDRPQGILVNQDGFVFICDYCNHRIQVF